MVIDTWGKRVQIGDKIRLLRTPTPDELQNTYYSLHENQRREVEAAMLTRGPTYEVLDLHNGTDWLRIMDNPVCWIKAVHTALYRPALRDLVSRYRGARAS